MFDVAWPSPADGLLTSGEFARRSRLSMKALRLYDRMGLLRPAVVEPGNGYRRYAEGQLDTARLIALLRRLDMPLAQIATITATRGPVGAELLGRYWAEVEERLAVQLTWQRDATERLLAVAGRHGGPAGPRFVVFHGSPAEDRAAGPPREVYSYDDGPVCDVALPVV